MQHTKYSIMYLNRPTRHSFTSEQTAVRAALVGAQFSKFCSSVLFTLLAISAASIISAQEDTNLDFLIFEPVLIETRESESLNGDEVITEVTVTELTTLPKGDNVISASEYLLNRIAEENNNQITTEENSIIAYEESIKELELDGGAYAPALIQELVAISKLHQNRNEHEQALEYLDQALHVNRVNLGLYNLDQQEIVEEKIHSLVALGDLYEADQQQEYLFRLNRRNFGDTSVSLLPALIDYAEWNIYAFDSRLITNPGLNYGADSRAFAENKVSNSIGAEDFRMSRLANAQVMYRTIIQILLKNYGFNDPRIVEMEKRLALTNYFFATNLGVTMNTFSSSSDSPSLNSPPGFYETSSRISSNSMGYRHGRQSLERRLEYLYQMENTTPKEIAKAKIELGDWQLTFKKRTVALGIYEDAYTEFQSQGVDQQDIDALFSPTFPDSIPEFITYRYSREAHNIPADLPLDYQGWVDIQLTINRFGRPQYISILRQSPTATEEIQDRLLRFLKSSTTFRPRFANDSLLTEDTLQARYYYSY